METVLTSTLYDEQLHFERESTGRGVARYRRLAQEAVQRGEGAALRPAERLLVHWLEIYRLRIRKEQREIAAGKSAPGRGIYGLYLLNISPAKTAVLAMHTIVSKCMADPLGPTVAQLAIAVGRAVNGEWNFLRLRSIGGQPWRDLVHTDRRRFKPGAVNRVANRHRPGARWSLKVQAYLGATLVSLLVQVASVASYDEPMKAAFEQYMRRVGIKTKGHIRLTPKAWQIIEDGHAYLELMRPMYEPMIVKPLAWTATDRGGYIELATDLVKKSQPQSGMNLTTVREAVNCINATPWRINRRVLEVVDEIYASGGGVAGIPRADDLAVSAIPSDFETNAAARLAWKKQAAKTHRQNVSELAERVVFRYKLDIAQRYVDREAFYFPHQLDFRGRMYPIPLFLHHQGDDLCRGLLEFAEPKAPGDRGEFWLKVHMANCCGLDKVAFEQRVGWVDDNRQAIEGWAADPLSNTGWMDADDGDSPFQALAAAMALSDADAAEHLPIQLDGSNNAFQHYGAMLRCETTGRLTNLIPSDSPQDLYAEVAGKVEAMVARDAEKGDAVARSLEGWITRKIVKDTVMTSAYGVTPIGARNQVYEHLKAAGFSEERLYHASRYLSRKSLEGVRRVCVAAHKAMTWLAKCGRLIADADQPIRWTTPLSLQVEQPYRRTAEHKILTILQKITIRSHDDEDSPVSLKRQVNGFAPNFIHSLDASHLMCVALACHDESIRFAGVHDSFWTHAADSDRLRDILREQFILLHETPAHLTLYDELRTKHPEIKFPTPPKCGNLDLSEILHSRYFFS